MRGVLVRAGQGHARDVAGRMRPADALEVWASSEQTPLEACEEAIAASPRRAWALYLGGELGGICGLCPDLGDPRRAFPWLLSTTAVDRHPVTFWRLCKETVRPLWLREFEVLENAVDARHTQALRWAARLGFDVAPAEPFGMLGMPFHRITLRR